MAEKVWAALSKGTVELLPVLEEVARHIFEQRFKWKLGHKAWPRQIAFIENSVPHVRRKQSTEVNGFKF